jgi:phosphoribosylformylglycinamidine synthase
VGAGGLANAVPEAVAHSARGARINLRDVPSAETGMSPLEIWCNEAQERYLLAIRPEALAEFAKLAQRERCPYAVIGVTTGDGELIVSDPLLGGDPVHMPIEVLLGKPPRMRREVSSVAAPAALSEEFAQVNLREALYRVLRLPAVADKTFLDHRRSHRRWTGQPRSLRRPAGAGRRRGSHDQRLPPPRGEGWPSANERPWHYSIRPLRPRRWPKR